MPATDMTRAGHREAALSRLLLADQIASEEGASDPDVARHLAAAHVHALLATTAPYDMPRALR